MLKQCSANELHAFLINHAFYVPYADAIGEGEKTAPGTCPLRDGAYNTGDMTVQRAHETIYALGARRIFATLGYRFPH